MTVEYNTCDLCNVEEETYRLIWGQDQHENIGVYLYGKIFVNENTYMALCKPCFKKRKYDMSKLDKYNEKNKINEYFKLIKNTMNS